MTLAAPTTPDRDRRPVRPLMQDRPPASGRCSTAPCGSPRAGSTPRSGPSDRSAAHRDSWCPASGAEITDADGRTYVDLVGSWGPMILGHAHPGGAGRGVRRRLSRGLVVRHTRARARCCWPRRSSPEYLRCSRFGWCRRAPRRPCRRSGWPAGSPGGRRSSSSPAATTATSTRCWPRPVPGSPPSPCRTRPASPRRPPREVIVLPYNDIDAVRAAFAAHPGEIAAVITEAAAANMGVVPPLPGFNAGLAADRARRRGAADHRRGDDRIPGQPVRDVRAGRARSRAGSPT